MKDESKPCGRVSLHPLRPAFTLVEILVVMGIIVLLVSILVPLVMRSYRQAGRIRAQADLQTITTALEAYKIDFGDFPQTGNDLYSKNHGAALLCKALLGPYGDGLTPANAPDMADPPTFQPTVAYAPGDVFRNGAGTYVYVTLVNAKAGTPETDDKVFAPFDPRDGADGPGFRKRAGGAGPISPPYLQPGKIAVRGTYLLDHYGNPILYFPASRVKRDLTLVASGLIRQPYVDQLGTPPAPGAIGPLYSADDNFENFARRNGDGQRLPAETDPIVLARIRIMLGDYNANGYIDTTTVDAQSKVVESAISAPYLLWTAGPDGVLGPIGLDLVASPSVGQVLLYQRAVLACDDITNFR